MQRERDEQSALERFDRECLAPLGEKGAVQFRDLCQTKCEAVRLE